MFRCMRLNPPPCSTEPTALTSHQLPPRCAEPTLPTPLSRLRCTDLSHHRRARPRSCRSAASSGRLMGSSSLPGATTTSSTCGRRTRRHPCCASTSTQPPSRRSRGPLTRTGCWHRVAERPTDASASGTRRPPRRSIVSTQARRCATCAGRRISTSWSRRMATRRIRSSSGATRR